MRKMLLGMRAAGEDLVPAPGLRRITVKCLIWTANVARPWVRVWSPRG